MEGSPSFETVDDEFILDEIYGEVDFDFDLTGVHSDAKSLLQSFVKRELVESALQEQYRKWSTLKESASAKLSRKTDTVRKSLLEKRRNLSSENLRAMLENKRHELEKLVQAPPFLRTSDKIAFTLGIIVLCVSEWIILKRQELMPFWYTLLLIPLMLARYYTYSKIKFTYFMIDFCYFAQIILLVSIYLLPQDSQSFQIAFATSNGPPLVGLVMWRNSLVFHDLDKLTSVFIHFFPSLVTFCRRWYSVDSDVLCPNNQCAISFYHAMVIPMFCYTIWQVLYLIQTEILDATRIRSDKTIMTSVRWMSEVKPHPLWVFYRKHGANVKFAYVYLAVTQYVYTIGTLLPVFVIYSSFEMHAAYLALIFIASVWNGANFYFEIFTETYSKRLQRYLKQVDQKVSEEIQKESATS
eukprot:TRINITY_DN3399_c0_g1_i1.p1 TRINITY_DN3399_c0_g1~~TRINITY_DN3399_c0_g1_i1.p1  ORF type:complete len:411 (+),score=27.96 TRINITY_DN3399_c0_g1_i1:91-1323(+)